MKRIPVSTHFPLLAAILVLPLLSACGSGEARPSDAAPATITLDYAYYSPISLVVKHFGWLEDEFREEGTHINWVLSLGSNKANEYSQSGTAHFASTAGVAALLARANGVPIKTIYVYSRPEWTALVAPAQGGVTEVADLRGRKVAATRGTDPYFFLLQALDEAGISHSDVEIVHLQHGEGKAAMDRGDVDAWAGLDPYMAQGELESGDRLFFRRPAFNTYGFLNALESFVERHPVATRRVVATYERGRRWIIENPDEAAEILAQASRQDVPVARKVLIERNDLSNPVPGDEHVALLQKLAPILKSQRIVSERADLEGAVSELLEPSFARDAVRAAADLTSSDAPQSPDVDASY
ncbi:MAG: aliphatic sulfonate ABC transporter substrate-binding protein [Bacteroidota bacterium]